MNYPMMFKARTADLWGARDLLWQWVARNIRARYQQSALGWFWAIIQPAAQVAMFTVIFTLFVPVDTGEFSYIVFSYIAIVPWTFFASSLTDMSNSLVDNMNLVTKIYFPREVLPIAALLARFMDFVVASALFVVLMIIYDIPVFAKLYLFLPLILAVQFVILLGVGFALSALNVFFRDVRSLLVLVIQVWFYGSPIVYPSTVVPEWLKSYYFLNPMAGVIEGYRDVVLYGQAPGFYLFISGVFALVTFVAGYWFFKRVEFQFADIV